MSSDLGKLSMQVNGTLDFYRVSKSFSYLSCLSYQSVQKIVKRVLSSSL